MAKKDGYSERILICLRAQDKHKIRIAAHLSGQSISYFIRSNALLKAKEVMAHELVARPADRGVGGKSAANTGSKSQTKKGDRRNRPGLQML